MQNGAKAENDDLQLIQGFNEGKDEAFRKIFERFKKDLCFFANRLTKNQQESEDIVSESFIKLFQRHPDFGSLSNIKAFLYLCTRNACFNWLNKNKVAGTVVPISEYDQVYNIPELIQGEPHWATVETELIIKIKELVEALPLKCREIFKKHYYEHMSQVSIAKELGVTEATVSGQLNNARAKLKALLLLASLLLVIKSIISFLIN
jgi:RNA polymerase sigma-70 factor (ECF subfamily)